MTKPVATSDGGEAPVVHPHFLSGKAFFIISLANQVCNTHYHKLLVKLLSCYVDIISLLQLQKKIRFESGLIYLHKLGQTQT